MVYHEGIATSSRLLSRRQGFCQRRRPRRRCSRCRIPPGIKNQAMRTPPRMKLTRTRLRKRHVEPWSPPLVEMLTKIQRLCLHTFAAAASLRGGCVPRRGSVSSLLRDCGDRNAGFCEPSVRPSDVLEPSLPSCSLCVCLCVCVCIYMWAFLHITVTDRALRSPSTIHYKHLILIAVGCLSGSCGPHPSMTDRSTDRPTNHVIEKSCLWRFFGRIVESCAFRPRWSSTESSPTDTEVTDMSSLFCTPCDEAMNRLSCTVLYWY